jgi:tetratricopeptide (TPR) repeat protein
MRPLLGWTVVGVGAWLLIASLSCGRPYPVDPETLIARAAAERRELELRLPGEPYATTVSTRSGASHRNDSVDLAEAEAMLLRQMRTGLLTPRLQRLHSRVHLLRGRWNDAVASAQLAQEGETGAEVDLANAYLGRALAQHNARDLQFALEYFGEVLAANPAEPVALFNRALTLEQLYLYDRAQADCEALLAVDKTSGWGAEAQERLARLRRKTQDWRQTLSVLGATEESYPELTDRIPPEAMLETAITVWMPAMVSSNSQRSRQARNALARLAADLSSHHGDRWLLEMLSRNPVAPAWTALAGAVVAGQSGRRDTALRLSIQARRLFAQQSVFSGAARARMEQIYALSRSFRASECLREADSLSRDLKGKSYAWIAGQLSIERSVCAFHLGKFDDALDGIAATLDTLSAARLDTLRLRALGVQSSFYRILGDGPRTIRTGCNGLEVFWNGYHPPGRAYHFLGEMFLNAEREGCWRSAQMFAREAVDRIALGKNRLTEASARARLASISLRLGDHQEAVRQAELAARFFAEFRNDRSHREFELTNAVALAEAHLAGGQAEEARRALAEFAAGDEGQTIYSRLALRRVRGLIHDRSGDWTGARAELIEAAQIAEASTRNLASAASRLRWKQEAGPAFRTLARIILEHENPEQALALW